MNNSVLLEPLLDLEHDVAPRHLELRRVLRPLRVHVGTVGRPLDEDGRRALAKGQYLYDVGNGRGQWTQWFPQKLTK